MLWGGTGCSGPYVRYELERIDFYRYVLRSERWPQDEIDALSLHELVRLAEVLLVKSGCKIPEAPSIPEEEQLRLVVGFGGQNARS